MRRPSVPNPAPQPWASAQALCLPHGRPQHRAASGPALPGWSQGPGGPLPQSTQPSPRPGRKLQGQELALPRLAHWPSCLLGPPARLPQPPPGMAGTEEGPKRQTLLPVSTCSPSPQQGIPESQAPGAPLRVLLVSLRDSLLGSPQGALEFHGHWGTGGESWGLQAPGRLEQGAVWPPSPVVGRGRRPWLARRPQPGRERREPGWSRPTRRGATWCARPLRGTPAAAAIATTPPARCLPWGRPPP